MWAVSLSPIYSDDPDFAQVISRKFERGRFLIVGGDPEKLKRQFKEAGREAGILGSWGNLAQKLEEEPAARFETAIWFYPPEKSDDDRVAELLSRCATDILLIPGTGTDGAERRPQLVACFRRFGLLPDYACDLGELNPGAIRLSHHLSGSTEALVLGVETAFARLNRRLGRLERLLRLRETELEAADQHIASLEGKLLKLKQYRSDLKLLKEQKRALRKSPERRIGQVLLAPYRLPERAVKAVLKRLRAHGPRRERAVASSEYQEWLQRQRPSARDLERMRREARAFAFQPLISLITPVYDTPLQRLEEAVESVLAQAYENWELLLVDDGSSAPDLLKAFPDLARRDRRIILVKVGKHEGISAASNQALALARGEWVSFLDHDDVIEPDALFQMVKLLQTHRDADLIYSDEDKLAENGYEAPLFKPDWSPDFFLSYNYVGHLTMVRREIAQRVGGFRREFDSAQDYDLFLRIAEQTNRIHHIPRVLYHWRRSADSSASSVRQKPGQLDASRRAVEDYLKRRGDPANVVVDWRTHAFCVRRDLSDAKKILIIIFTQHNRESLERCIESLTSETIYPSYEIVVARGDGQARGVQAVWPRIPRRIVEFSGASGVSAVKNSAVKQTDGPWLLFLNDDVEVTENDWLMIMAEHVQRREVGAVGARLLNPNGTIEHAGIVLGVNGIAQPAFHGFPAEHLGANRQLQITRNCSAVSGACMLVRREVFQELGGFDEHLSEPVADIDLCLKMRRAGYLIVYTPFAKLYRREMEYGQTDTGAEQIFRDRWADVLQRDPYYNPNLSREHADFTLGK